MNGTSDGVGIRELDQFDLPVPEHLKRDFIPEVANARREHEAAIDGFIRDIANEQDRQADPGRNVKDEEQLTEKGFFMRTTYSHGMANHEIVKPADYLLAKRHEERSLEDAKSMLDNPDAFLRSDDNIRYFDPQGSASGQDNCFYFNTALLGY